MPPSEQKSQILYLPLCAKSRFLHSYYKPKSRIFKVFYKKMAGDLPAEWWTLGSRPAQSKHVYDNIILKIINLCNMI